MRCAGFSLRWLLLLWSTGSRRTGSVVVARGLSSCGSRALERRLSSCGARAQLLCSMWDLPGPGLKPVSPALAGRFLTTELPGKPLGLLFKDCFVYQAPDLSHLYRPRRVRKPRATSLPQPQTKSYSVALTSPGQPDTWSPFQTDKRGAFALDHRGPRG